MKYETISDLVTATLMKIYIDQVVPDLIYHYTSPDGLLSILQNKKLWFSKIDFLNDTKERVYVLDVYQKVLKDLISDDKIDEAFLNAINEISLNNRSSFHEADEEDVEHYTYGDADYYICCFSKDRDSLPMWNYYSKGFSYEGYNLECNFDREVFYGEMKDHKYNLKEYNVIYDSSEQEKILENIIMKFYDFYKRDKSLIQKIKEGIAEILTVYSFVFKAPCFKHENEFRIVLAVPKSGNDKFKILYRTKNGCIIPYIELKFSESFITGITIGPLLNKKTAEHSLRFFLENAEYRDKWIYYSKIPIRY